MRLSKFSNKTILKIPATTLSLIRGKIYHLRNNKVPTINSNNRFGGIKTIHNNTLTSNKCSHRKIKIILKILFSTNKMGSRSSHLRTSNIARILPSLLAIIMLKTPNPISSWNSSQINFPKISKNSYSNQINIFSSTPLSKINHNNNQGSTICSEADYLSLSWDFFFTISLTFFVFISPVLSPISLSLSKLFILITLFLLAPFSDMNL